MMLKPRDIEILPDALIELYSQVEHDILADMARRISTYDFWIPSVEWQRKKLIEMGNFQSYITEALAARTPYIEKEIEQLMQLAATKSLKFDTAIYKEHGLNPPPLAASEALRKTLNAGLRQTMGTFKNLTATTANTASKQFEDALDRAWLQVTSGAFDQRTAMRMAIKDLARQGVGAIRYPSGHVDNLEVAVTRAIRTGVNQTCLRLQLDRADEMGCDLVEVTAHAGARPSHAEWQGQIYSRSGNHPKYPEFESSTGYGTGAGLGGWNCRHSFFPYFEGSTRAYTEKQLREYNAQNYEYNDHKMTEYEATQHQRYIERQIRRWKREEQAMKAAGLSTDEAVAKIAEWQVRQKDFLKQTGLKRRTDREQIGVTGHKVRAILNETDLYAINQYKSSQSYILNEALRNRFPLGRENARMIHAIDQAIAKLPEYQGVVYRSLDSIGIRDIELFWLRYTPGNIVEELAFTSTSTSVYDESMGIQMIIQSKHGRDMREYNLAEMEVLFKRGSTFFVENREGNTIWMREI